MSRGRERDRSPGGSSLSRRGFLASGVASVAALSGCLVHGEDSRGLEGRIVMDGSNTVLPHGAAVAEEFTWLNNRVQISVRGSGTGAGFQRFCEGDTDIQNASRGIHGPEDAETDGQLSETELCQSNGVDYIELEALVDGLAIFVHPENHWCDCLTVEELHDIWRPDTTVETWGDVREEWADEPFGDEEIVLYGRDAASGTFDSFTEAINGEVGAIRNDYSASSDTNVIVRGVSGNRYALGFGGAGYFYENTDRLQLVGVDDGDGCVEPTTRTIESGEYTPLTRSMYVYISTAGLDREEMREFARFYFEEIDDQTHEAAVEADIADPDETLTWTQWAARKVGFYAAADDVVDRSREELERALEERE